MMKKFLNSIVAFLLVLAAGAQIKHIEPLNWWVGMIDPNLQLMVNGNGIRNTQVSISYPGVSLKNTVKGDSENYLLSTLSYQPTLSPVSSTFLF